MRLTPQNMESREGWISHSIYRDIARMDDEQLGKYMRMAFTGERDTNFLPEPFWDYWFDSKRHGSSGDGRERPSPALFFAGLHNAVGSVARGTFRIGEEGEKKPDFEYRPRFRRVLKSILLECFNFDRKPTLEQQKLASFAIEALGAIQSPEEFRVTGEDIIASRNKEGASIPFEYPQQLEDDLEKLQAERDEMLLIANILNHSGEFGELKLDWDSNS